MNALSAHELKNEERRQCIMQAPMTMTREPV
jgi:hypothetical protein